jgi:hypothetical protein
MSSLDDALRALEVTLAVRQSATTLGQVRPLIAS